METVLWSIHSALTSKQDSLDFIPSRIINILVWELKYLYQSNHIDFVCHEKTNPALPSFGDMIAFCLFPCQICYSSQTGVYALVNKANTVTKGGKSCSFLQRYRKNQCDEQIIALVWPLTVMVIIPAKIIIKNSFVANLELRSCTCLSHLVWNYMNAIYSNVVHFNVNLNLLVKQSVQYKNTS